MAPQHDDNETTETVQLEYDEILDDIQGNLAENNVIRSNDELEKICQLLIKIRENPNYYLFNVNPSIFNHLIFICIRNTIINVLDKLNGDESEVNDEEKQFLNESSYILSKIASIENVCSIFEKLFVQKQFINPIQQCMHDIATNGIHMNDYNIVYSIKCLLEAFIEFRNKTRNYDEPMLLLLLDSAIEFICSDYYLESFRQVEVKATEFHNAEYLFLYVCPYYIHGYHGKHRHEKANQLSERISTYCQQLFKKFSSSTIEQSEIVLLEAFIQILSVLLTLPIKTFHQHHSLIDQLISMIKITERLLTDVPSGRHEKTEFIYLTITLIYNITADSNLRQYIKEQHNDVIEIFERLSSANTIEDDRIRFLANILYCLLVNTDNIENIRDIGRLTGTLVSYLVSSEQAPSKSYDGITLERLLATTKYLLQESVVQESYIQQEQGLPILVKCATEPNHDDVQVKLPSLETLWILVFLKKAAAELKNNPTLMDYLKSILLMDSTKPNPLRRAADGIYWKLEEEPKRLQDQNKSEQEEVNYEFDAMMSYTHANKELCLKLFTELTKNKFNIWIDQEQMFGSTMERMGEGVENSPFLIVCMSRKYAASQACQAEATYAKGKGRGLIPIMLEKDFEPRGWLAILLADSFYVNFTKKSFDDAFQDLLQQIYRHRNHKKRAGNTDPNVSRPLSGGTSSNSTNKTTSDTKTVTIDRETSPHRRYTHVGTSRQCITVDSGTKPRYTLHDRATSSMKPSLTDRATSPIEQKSVYVFTDSIIYSDHHTSTEHPANLADQSKNNRSKVCTVL